MRRAYVTEDGQWWWDGFRWHKRYVRRGRPVNHTFHLLMTIFTCGFWAPVWVVCALNSRWREDTQPTFWYGDQARVR